MTLNDRELLNAFLRTDFEAFIQFCFQTLNPGEEFRHNWHISAMAYALESVRRGERTRQIISLPPRYLKSTIVSVAFPAFVLGHDPTRKIVSITYGNELALQFARERPAINVSSTMCS